MLKNLDKKFVSYSFNVSVRVLINLLSIKILTNFFDKDEIGMYYLLLSIVQFYNLVILNPFNSFYSRNIFEFQKKNKLFEASLNLIVFYIICVPIAILIATLLYNYLDVEINFILYSIYLIFSFLISTILRNVLQVLNSFDLINEYTKLNLISCLVSLGFSILFVFVFDSSIIFWLIGIISSELLILIYLFKYIKDPIILKINFNYSHIHEILKFSLPILVTTLVIWIQSFSYRFAIKKYFTSEDLAYSAIGFGVATLIFGSSETLFNNYFKKESLVGIQSNLKKEISITWNKVASNIITQYIIIFFFIISIGKSALYILTDETYIVQSVKFLYLGSISEFFRVINNQFVLISNYTKKTSKIILSYVIGGAITVTFFSLNIITKIDQIFYVLIVSNLISLIISIYSMKKLISYNIQIRLTFLFLSILPLVGFIFWNIYSFKLKFVINIMVILISTIYTAIVLNANFEKIKQNY